MSLRPDSAIVSYAIPPIEFSTFGAMIRADFAVWDGRRNNQES